MKHILYDMGNFLLKEKNRFLSGQNKFLARDGEWPSLGRAGHNALFFVSFLFVKQQTFCQTFISFCQFSSPFVNCSLEEET